MGSYLLRKFVVSLDDEMGLGGAEMGLACSYWWIWCKLMISDINGLWLLDMNLTWYVHSYGRWSWLKGKVLGELLHLLKMVECPKNDGKIGSSQIWGSSGNVHKYDQPKQLIIPGSPKMRIPKIIRELQNGIFKMPVSESTSLTENTWGFRHWPAKQMLLQI